MSERPPEPSDGRRLATLAAHSAQSLLVVTLAQRAVSLLNIILLPRLLSVAEFGPIGSALALVGLFSMIADSGIQLATVQALSTTGESGADPRRVAGAAIAVRTASGLVGAAVGCAVLMIGPFSTVVRVVGVIALAGLLNPVWCVYGAVLQARFELGRLRLVTLAMTVVSAIVSVAFAATGGGAIHVIASQTAVAVLFSPIVVHLGRSRQRADLRLRLTEMRALFGTAWRLGASTVLAVIYYRFDTILLTAVAANSEVALYYASYRLTEPFLVPSQIIEMAAFPALARLHSSDPLRAAALAARVIRIVTGIGLALAVIGIVLAGPIVSILYGAHYAAATPIIQTLLVATLLMAANLSVYQSALAFGRANLLLAGAAAGAIVNIVANAALIPLLRAEGAAIATIITEVGVTLVAVPWMLSTLPIEPVRTALRSGLVAACLGLTVLLSRTLPTVALVPAALPAAGLIVVASRVVDRRLIGELLALRSRPELRHRRQQNG